MQSKKTNPKVYRNKQLLLKLLTVWIIFILLHYAYDLFPGAVTSYFSAVSESVFQHLKIGFWSYILVSIGEFFLFRPDAGRFIHFTASRLLGLLFFLWAMIIVFFTAPAILGGPAPTMFLEIINANLSLGLSIFAGIIIERNTENITFSKASILVLILLFALLLMEFSIFTYRLPWADLFANPPGY